MKRIELIYEPEKLLEVVAVNAMNELAIEYDHIGHGNILLKDNLGRKKQVMLARILAPYGVHLVNKETVSLVERIKNCIKLVVASEKFRKQNLSTVLSERLGYSYSHLSTVFSKETFTSIENFFIFVKIEKCKELLMKEGKRLSDVAHELDHSSVSHLSRQFKNVTGLTVSQYLKLLDNRKPRN